MKYSLQTSFARFTFGLLIAILFSTILGLMVSTTEASAFCDGAVFCLPTQPIGYIKLLHVLLVGISFIVLAIVWRKAWRKCIAAC